MQRHGYRDWDKIFAFCRPYILSHKKEFKVLFATIFLGTFISNLIPLIWGKLIDSLSNINIGKLLLFLLLYAVVTLLLFFMGVFESFLGAKLDYKIEGEIKQVMLAKALRMSCAELDAFDTGELMSRITSDAGSIIQFVIDALTSIVTIVINVITALVFSFEISPHLSAISLAFVPLSILSNIAFKNKFRELNERQKQYGDSLSSFLVNTLNHIFDIKAYRLEENETKQYANFLDKGWMLHKRNYRLNSFASAFSSVASVASVSVTILISGLLINKGLFTIGKMISFQGYIDKLSTSVNKLLGMNYSAQTTCVAIDRIQNLLSKSDDFEKSLKINETGIHIREISFEEVFFQYKEGIPVLENVSLSIREPGLYAFVGENGCGKTTILKLIMRYYRVVNGQIKLNDDCINDMSTLCVRSSIGYYGKSVYIRNDSLLNNLCLGSSMQIQNNIVPSNIKEACEIVGLSKFIESLPQRYNTQVGEDGKLLSSGQKQKIAIVRAMLSESSVLLFDEITSDLDGASEFEIISILRKLSKNRIVIIVSHRINSIAYSNKIFFMKDGKISASGAHSELLESSPAYRSLFKHQKK